MRRKKGEHAVGQDMGGITRLNAAAPSVRQRIARRLQLLRGWVDEGVPAERVASLPASLRGLAKWDDPELGIVPIASPNDISRGHPLWGREIAEMLVLIATLKARYPKDGGHTSRPSRLHVSVAQVEATEVAWQRAVGQWHAERDGALTARREAEQYRFECAGLRAQLASLEAEVRELRRALAKANGWESRP